MTPISARVMTAEKTSQKSIYPIFSYYNNLYNTANGDETDPVLQKVR